MLKKQIINLSAATALGVGSFLGMTPVAMAASNSNAGNKVTICHATGSASNPYVQISPNANGVINGHVGHQDGRDIIPPFDYNDHGTPKHFSGQNWNAQGIAIFNNGCRVGGQGGGVTPPVTPPSGGQGGGGNVASATSAQGQGQVLGSQVSAVPAGAVGAGSGGATSHNAAAPLAGLIASLIAISVGIRRLAKLDF